MRNSVMPMILVLVVVVAAMLLLRSESKPGLNGPDLFPGIFRLPKQDKFHVDSAVLASTNRIEADGAVPANRGEAWRVVQVAAKDHHALTRSVVLGLGEQLTGHGCVTLMAPVDAPAFPMGVARIITVATEQAEIPAELGGPAQATVRITSRLARLSDGHPAATLLPHPEGPTATAFTIVHHTPAATGVAGWPNWWAALGRGLAAAAVAHLAPGGLPPLVDPQTRAWLPTLAPMADWGTALALAPTTERLRWDFAFQEPLVRGWVGHVTGLTAPDRSGVEKPTLDQLLGRMASGKWEEAGITDQAKPAVRMFTRTVEGRSEWFSIAPREGGWAVACWQERSGIPSLFSDWAKAAAMGDQGAKRLLHAHRECPLLSPAQREAARHALDALAP
jgi:hypothetical protein